MNALLISLQQGALPGLCACVERFLLPGLLTPTPGAAGCVPILRNRSPHLHSRAFQFRSSSVLVQITATASKCEPPASRFLFSSYHSVSHEWELLTNLVMFLPHLRSSATPPCLVSEIQAAKYCTVGHLSPYSLCLLLQSLYTLIHTHKLVCMGNTQKSYALWLLNMLFLLFILY